MCWAKLFTHSWLEHMMLAEYPTPLYTVCNNRHAKAGSIFYTLLLKISVCEEEVIVVVGILLLIIIITSNLEGTPSVFYTCAGVVSLLPR